MRKILFRGKRIDTGEWVYGAYMAHDYDGHTIFNQNPEDGTLQEFEVIPETVGQYTGLDDKNNKNIFEGDILRDDESIIIVNSLLNGGFSMAYSTMVGKWVNYGDLLDYLEVYKREVIDNVHDNPELVGVRE